MAIVYTIPKKIYDKICGLSIVAHGQTTVAAAGTRVILIAALTTTNVLIVSKSTNTGKIYVGTVAVTSANGLILEPGDSVSLDVDHNTTNVYLDAEVGGEGVSFIALN